jgi:hypothetical protein
MRGYPFAVNIGFIVVSDISFHDAPRVIARNKSGSLSFGTFGQYYPPWVIGTGNPVTVELPTWGNSTVSESDLG